jgi:hypothetical protein
MVCTVVNNLIFFYKSETQQPEDLASSASYKGQNRQGQEGADAVSTDR